nr:very short patch repair endonuclease [Antribacter gilvus]
MRAKMQRVRSRDTKPEMAVRRELHRRGRRYFVHQAVLPGRRRVDVVFPRTRVAVFIDGCFWHSCPDHLRMPASNLDYWAMKLRRNRERDRQTDRDLEAAGWTVVRVWEHEPPDAAADRIEAELPTRS